MTRHPHGVSVVFKQKIPAAYSPMAVRDEAIRVFVAAFTGTNHQKTPLPFTFGLAEVPDCDMLVYNASGDETGPHEVVMFARDPKIYGLYVFLLLKSSGDALYPGRCVVLDTMGCPEYDPHLPANREAILQELR
jgi:hypothetical protein